MESINYKGFKIEIENDENPMNPRTDWDNGSVMVCKHRKYSLGDKDHGINLDGCDGWLDIKQAIVEQKSPIVILPLYLYDHSGITMNTTGFNSGFDSCQVGFIFVDEEKAEMIGWTKEYIETLSKRDSEEYKGKTRVEILTDFMISDVETYDNYISGQVYRFNIEDCEDGNCGGYYGDEHEKSGLLDSAKDTIDVEIKRRVRKRILKLKELILAKVPMIYRQLPTI